MVSVKCNECSIIDMAFEKGWVGPLKCAQPTGKKVAVVGSGPSGLACAQALCAAGHEVTVIERADRAGGLMIYGIPNMKLDKSVVARRVKLLEESGVRFVTGCDAAKEYPGDLLLRSFDAAVLCTGSTRPRPFSVDGCDAQGIYYAVDFLRQNTKSLLDSGHADGNFISAYGKDVVVIGGGDTGTDCVATAIRHGCRSVEQFEIMPAAPDKRAPGNPWPEWPKVFKTDYGQEEAKFLFGHDPRHFLLMTTSVVKDASGSVSELKTVNVEWKFPAGGGRPSPVPVAGSEKTGPPSSSSSPWASSGRSRGCRLSSAPPSTPAAISRPTPRRI
jgi:glutamate synthase (NADPH/NADH) small chain